MKGTGLGLMSKYCHWLDEVKWNWEQTQGLSNRNVSIVFIVLCYGIWNEIPTKDYPLPWVVSWERRVVINKKRKHSKAKMLCEEAGTPVLHQGWGPNKAASICLRQSSRKHPSLATQGFLIYLLGILTYNYYSLSSGEREWCYFRGLASAQRFSSPNSSNSSEVERAPPSL